MRTAFVGFGALGHYVEDMLTEFGLVDGSSIAYFDDGLHRAGRPNAFPFSAHADDQFADAQFFVCLGYKHLTLKHRLTLDLLARGRRLPSFIHPSAYVHRSVELGSASFVYPGCSIDRGTTIGRGTWITNADVIAHDCTIGDACWFGASVTLSGHVRVADRTFIGSGATVSNDVHLGADVIVGLGTALTKNVSDRQSVIGNPMRILNKPITLI